jgi:2-(3-amino-3-carboxypropyl)histidine synthase
MEDTSAQSQLRQPKKRFVGRRTADAQAQKEPTGQNDVESTQVQKGMQDLLRLLITPLLIDHV